jgi:hypothetical protein
MSILKVDASDSDIRYTAVCTIDVSPKGKFPCKGGYTYPLKLIVEDNRENKTNVRSFMFVNCDGFYTFSAKTRSEGGKAKIGFSKKVNPAIINLFSAVESAIAAECDRLGLYKSRQHVARSSTIIAEDGTEKTYDDTVFFSLKLTDDMHGCYTILQGEDLDTGKLHPILSNEVIPDGEESSTIRSYVKESGYNTAFADFLMKLYNCTIKITKTTNNEKRAAITVNPKTMATHNALVTADEFDSIMKSQVCDILMARIKSCYQRVTDETTYCSLVCDKSKSHNRIDSRKEEEDLWNMQMQISSSKSQNRNHELMEVNPDEDLDDMM